MASELRRPPTRTGSGSRPPTSRFQEGSMNDRASAAPPAHFLGPDELGDYESQFFAEPLMIPEARRRRPLSASGKLQATTIYRHVTAQDPRQEQTVRHKKSSGFFGRVRDALFNRGSGGGQQQAPKDDGRRKHNSLQEPVQQPSRSPPPRPEYIHANRAQSEINIAQMFSSNTGGAADRPSREEVMASYNQLIASGFFQSHAIQSTRHAPPGSMTRDRRPPPLSMDSLTTAHPLGALSTAQASIRSGSISPLPAPRGSPNPQSRDSREFTSVPMGPPAAPRSSLSSLFSSPIPDLNKKDSRPLLRGRKRTRGDETPVLSSESHSPTTAGPTSYFAEPLKRVAKKLREMPSSTFQSRDDSQSRSNNNSSSKGHSYHEYQTYHQTAPDVVMSPPSPIIYSDSMYTVERPVRERSPSPMVLDTRGRPGRMEPETGRPLYEKAASGAAARRPRRTFSYTLTQSVHSRSRAIEREREREREMQLQQAREQQRHQARRDHSAHNSSNGGSRPPRVVARHSRQTPSHTPLGIWQRVSLEDTMIHRDSCDSTRSSYRSWRAEERMAVDSNSPSGRSSRRATPSPSPLRSMPGANRGGSAAVPYVVKAPERWHWSGKAYHLKDRGSRPELGVRRSEDSGTAFGNYGPYGKENDNWHTVDADGDIDVLWHQSSGGSRRSQEEYYRQQQQQWRIGNAL